MTSTAALSSPASANTPEIGRVDADYTLEHKYTRADGRIYLSGVQALVRLPLMQHLRDVAAGLDTAGFVSGYRGSPLGGLDLELWRARAHLEAAKVTFTPGLNEDLAATMVWGTQQTNLFPGATVQGVYGMWYGKGPGVDRSGDVFKHANAAGTSPFGGVLALAADDHACRSSTLPHGSEDEFVSAMMPILNPAGVQDILDMGLLGWAMSRYTGRWVGFKTIAETVESSASVDVDPFARQIVLPDDFALPPGGLSIRWPDPPVDQEMRLHRYAVAAAQAFARANGIDKLVLDSPQARLGIVTTGKSYLDVLQALEYLGLDAQACAQIGIRVYKVGMTWPLEPVGITAFARGLDDIVVVEEKKAFIERQMKELFYNWPASAGARPSIVGKYNEHGAWILPSTGELTPATIAAVIGKRIQRFPLPSAAIAASIEQRLRWMEAKEAEMALPRALFPRVPHYCSGCPHNTSTVVPEGSRALGGIGCHYMVTWMNRSTDTFTHMGGEGVTWSGQAPFTATPHVFQNLGDGTYFHSGSLAIRQSVATGVNITYKILYNDAVAMTGGQPVDGTLTVPDIAHQLRAEGIHEIVVVSDDIGKWTRRRERFPSEVAFHDRSELDAVQQRLRTIKGVSILIFDQTCATEKRRRRKRGKLIDPPKRVMINSLVCEGCGDCGEKSFCVSVLPKDTEFGRKREIDQSNCNKDYSCVSGFCPSFVTVHGGAPRKGKKRDATALLDALPEPPQRTTLEQPWNILITGVGGTGVVTIGALLGMAGHLEGKGATVLDQTGLAQKGGAVTTHIRIARQPADIHAVRIAAGEADLVLGCDMVVVNDYWALSKVRDGRTQVVLNTYEAMPGSFTTQPDLQFPAAEIIAGVRTALGGQEPLLLDATQLATALLGDAIASNLFVLGYAWQHGLVPLSHAALMRAIELNGAAVAMNQQAFAWGRLAAVDLPAVQRAAGLAPALDTAAHAHAAMPPSRGPGSWEDHDMSGQSAPRALAQTDADTLHADGDAPVHPLDDEQLAQSLDEAIARRVHFLTDYQDAAYAQQYRALVERVRTHEAQRAPGSTALSAAVARYAFKLMAYKDEYEVARLYTRGDFQRRVQQQFEGDYQLRFHLAPPLFAKKDANGQPIKREYGPWMFSAFKLLARLKFLRGGKLDVFGYTAERRGERQLIADYLATVNTLLQRLDNDNVGLAAQIASIPEHIRGYGHVKDAHLHEAKAREAALLAQWRNPKALHVVQAA
ncbi:indolepyruvate ferredoxin oxidoreductase family protein [Xanthomonas campestris]|jgi:indolepyruvate ferredoxin oxidoreductase|uniref:indolepyruvate ferredoxin oxidoreductase family protein n=1 Tax=Xanthomonas campestris TaxID=339 RepID=UPI0002F4C7F2|nr:indolepyruvate ferredoxin oxidoreductase family protein [Xanthomonas campestris]MCC5053312.1 indolepyruvate ferredoxin oxidoreductase family protein [Xanthomonas campestris pv. aberrans]MDM7681798.1 indolepyruvate ferredoxin oxidoreductase family protein [Xanthomonas campestris pv. campestris]MDM7688821.1 indolepyruvate ferredoxin oxidoreductase family protein [Xanthomonas campestris pv. campestris]MDM7702886.1 indolepyruvate ferredoxin oxidoreductase family protein [Xanthomonas campestris p